MAEADATPIPQILSGCSPRGRLDTRGGGAAASQPVTYIARVVPIVPSANYHQDTQEATSPITILGEPIIPNGLALCKLHHAAFDRNLLGVRPDLVVEVRTDILREVDGPMLKYGLQDMQGQRISVPHADRLRPRREFLEERFAAFERAA